MHDHFYSSIYAPSTQDRLFPGVGPLVPWIQREWNGFLLRTSSFIWYALQLKSRVSPTLILSPNIVVNWIALLPFSLCEQQDQLAWFVVLLSTLCSFMGSWKHLCGKPVIFSNLCTCSKCLLYCDWDMTMTLRKRRAYTHQYNIEKISRFLERAQAVAMLLIGALNVCGQKWTHLDEKL